MQWTKLICNAAYSAPCAISGMTVGEVLRSPTLGPISLSAAREAYAIATANRIGIDFDPEERVIDFAVGMPDAKPSVLLDLEAGRRSEIEFINGAVPRAAAKVGLTAPINEALTTLVREIEESSS